MHTHRFSDYYCFSRFIVTALIRLDIVCERTRIDNLEPQPSGSMGPVEATVRSGSGLETGDVVAMRQKISLVAGDAE